MTRPLDSLGFDWPVPTPVPRRMQVTVTTAVLRRHQYEGLFGHTFDAYDNALKRFPSAARIEVKAVPAAAAGEVAR